MKAACIPTATNYKCTHKEVNSTTLTQSRRAIWVHDQASCITRLTILIWILLGKQNQAKCWKYSTNPVWRQRSIKADRNLICCKTTSLTPKCLRKLKSLLTNSDSRLLCILFRLTFLKASRWLCRDATIVRVRPRPANANLMSFRPSNLATTWKLKTLTSKLQTLKTKNSISTSRSTQRLTTSANTYPRWRSCHKWTHQKSNRNFRSNCLQSAKTSRNW